MSIRYNPNPDFFHGFHADVWAAFAVGYTWILKGQQKGDARHDRI